MSKIKIIKEELGCDARVGDICEVVPPVEYTEFHKRMTRIKKTDIVIRIDNPTGSRSHEQLISKENTRRDGR